MQNDFHQRLAAVNADALKPLVQAMLGRADVEITEWQVARLAGGGGAMSGALGLTRFSGTARPLDGASSGSADLPWSLILKAMGRTPMSSEDPTAWNYWQREALVYRSGLLDQLPGVAAPRCYGVISPDDVVENDDLWVWMEAIPEAPEPWTLARYELAARHLGQFNGAYLTGYPLPQAAWFSRGRVDEWCDFFDGIATRCGQYADTETARRLFPGDLLARLQRFWPAHQELRAAYHQLPWCFCHHDAFRRNLLADARRPATVLIDWSLAGLGRVGEEAGVTTSNSLIWFGVPVEQAAELDALVFAGYVDGLRDAGWQGDVRQARLGYLVNAVLPLGLGWMLLNLELLQEPEHVLGISAAIGKPLDEILSAWASLQPILLKLGEEALQLASAMK